MSGSRELNHYYGGVWSHPKSTESLDVINPATAEKLARTPLADKEVLLRGFAFTTRRNCVSPDHPRLAADFHCRNPLLLDLFPVDLWAKTTTVTAGLAGHSSPINKTVRNGLIFGISASCFGDR